MNSEFAYGVLVLNKQQWSSIVGVVCDMAKRACERYIWVISLGLDVDVGRLFSVLSSVCFKVANFRVVGAVYSHEGFVHSGNREMLLKFWRLVIITVKYLIVKWFTL